jgi:hypothetical protein
LTIIAVVGNKGGTGRRSESTGPLRARRAQPPEQPGKGPRLPSVVAAAYGLDKTVQVKTTQTEQADMP